MDKTACDQVVQEEMKTVKFRKRLIAAEYIAAALRIEAADNPDMLLFWLEMAKKTTDDFQELITEMINH